MALAQRQSTGEDWVVVGRGDQEEAADDEQQQRVRLEGLEVTADDQRRVRWDWGAAGGRGLRRQLMTSSRGGSGGRVGVGALDDS